jgi:D-serine/D-alanine/glycine transporter
LALCVMPAWFIWLGIAYQLSHVRKRFTAQAAMK